MAVQDDPEVPPVLRFDAIRVATLVVLMLVALLSGGQAVYLATYVQDQRTTNECYQGQIDALTEWAATAVQASRSDRQAQRELLLAQAGASEDGRAAMQRYLGQLDEADRTRAGAPVPEPRCTR